MRGQKEQPHGVGCLLSVSTASKLTIKVGDAALFHVSVAASCGGRNHLLFDRHLNV